MSNSRAFGNNSW